MAYAHYLVAKRAAGWFITFEGGTYGPFPGGQTAAMVAAVQAANQAGKDGHDASVRLWVSASDVQTIWSFGRDPYPPVWIRRIHTDGTRPAQGKVA
jgi:hypothetical protein